MSRLGMICFAVVLLAGVSVSADVRERMSKRLPDINRLKDALVVGEDNKGYLALKGDVGDADKKLVEDENADRKEAYEMLAKQTKTSVELVQTRRAAQIAEKAKPGIWLQKPDGEWYKK
ncbi:MAG: YdbL family protein [Victivallales bacterium]|nr:YdbL family protein [Victivallales bacterium]